MTTLLVVLVIVLLLVVLMQMALLPTPAVLAKVAYVRRRELLTQAEQSFFIALEQAVNRRYRIFCQVRIADVLNPKPGSSSYRGAFNRISQKHFDFVLCDLHSFEVVMAIELDDQLHDRRDRIENDQLKNAACESADLPLLRWSTSTPFHAAEIESQLVVLLSTAEHGITQSFPAYIRPTENNSRSRALWANAVLATVLLGAGYFLVSRVAHRFSTPVATAAVLANTQEQRTANVASEAPKLALVTQRSAQEKELAWNRYYTPARNCENPKDWKIQVECGNEHMRKKKEFEAKWVSEKSN